MPPCAFSSTGIVEAKSSFSASPHADLRAGDFDRPLDSVSEADIRSLMNSGVRDGISLEYKKELRDREEQTAKERLVYLRVGVPNESLLTALRLSLPSGSRYCRVVSRSVCPVDFYTVTISYPLPRKRVVRVVAATPPAAAICFRRRGRCVSRMPVFVGMTRIGTRDSPVSGSAHSRGMGRVLSL